MPSSNKCVKFTYEVPNDDFSRAGAASSSLKNSLKQLQIDPQIIKRISIAIYEGEINMVIHANGGTIEALIWPDHIDLTLADVGPGIPDIDKAMQLGFSTASADIHALGFGAGMGLPNMKKNTDEMSIETELGVGTTIRMRVNF